MHFALTCVNTFREKRAWSKVSSLCLICGNSFTRSVSVTAYTLWIARSPREVRTSASARSVALRFFMIDSTNAGNRTAKRAITSLSGGP